MKWLALVLGERWGEVASLSPECLPISQPSTSQIIWDLGALLALLVPRSSCLDTSTPGRWIEWSPPPRLWCNIYQFDVLLGILVFGVSPSPLGKGFANSTAPTPISP